MKVIYKYEVRLELNLPIRAKIIDCEIQNDKICIWAVVDPNSITLHLLPDVIVLATGSEMSDYDMSNYTHLKTFHVSSFVWHVFANKRVL